MPACLWPGRHQVQPGPCPCASERKNFVLEPEHPRRGLTVQRVSPVASGRLEASPEAGEHSPSPPVRPSPKHSLLSSPQA